MASEIIGTAWAIIDRDPETNEGYGADFGFFPKCKCGDGVVTYSTKREAEITLKHEGLTKEAKVVSVNIIIESNE
jgi:hypothetical protein